MCMGALIYSICVGSLSGLLTSLDSRDFSYQEKLIVLMKIKEKYKLENSLLNRIKKALKYGRNKFNFYLN